MSEQESLGALAHEAFYRKLGMAYQQEQLPSKTKDPIASKCWEASAQAVAARVREECAQVAEKIATDFERAASEADTSMNRVLNDLGTVDCRHVANAIRDLNNSGEQS